MTQQTMQAAYIEQYGDEDQLIVGALARPEPAPGQLLIRVKAAGINPVDWMVRDGLLAATASHQLPLVVGWDSAGVIEQMDAQARQTRPDLQIGDEVFAYSPIGEQGAYAQYLAVDAELVAKKPATLDFHQSAAVPLAASTAWQALTQGGLISAGQTVLIHNGAGGVGSFAIQMAKNLGAKVIATASAAKESYVRSLGADEFIDYQTADFSQMNPEVDLVFAAVGGVAASSLGMIKPGGRLIALIDELTEEELQLAKQRNIFFQRWWVTPDASLLGRFATMIDAGALTVNVQQVLPLSAVKQAHQMSQSQRVSGKLVLAIP